MQTPEGGLAGLARRQWEKITTIDEIRKLVQDAREQAKQLMEYSEITSRFTKKEILARCVSEGFRGLSVVPRLRNEAVTKLETRCVSEDCTESSSTSLTRRVTILAFGSIRLKKPQPQRVVKNRKLFTDYT